MARHKAADDSSGGEETQKGGDARTSGVRQKTPARGRPSLAPTRLILFATREEEVVKRFEERQPVGVRVLGLDDVFGLLEMVREHEADDLMLIIDERERLFRPETVAALASSLPKGTRVVLWGISAEDLSEVETLAADRSFVVLEGSAQIEDLAMACLRGVSEAPPKASEVLRLLLVDDDDTYARSLARLLTTAGYEVFVANDGPAALDLCRDQSFAVILTDLHMPGMSGLSFAAIVRLALGDDAPQILMITAAPPDSVDRALVDAILQKPVAAPALLTMLRKLVPDDV